MFQFTLGIDLFICSWFVYLVTSLLLSVLLLLPMLTEKCQPAFECGYFVCFLCTRLARQKATWYVTVLTLPRMLNTRIAPLRVLTHVAADVPEWGDSSIGPAVAACAFGILLIAGTTNLALQGFSKCLSIPICPLLPQRALFLPFRDTWCLVLVLSWLFLHV